MPPPLEELVNIRCGWEPERYAPRHAIEREGVSYCCHARDCDYKVEAKGGNYCGWMESDD